MLHIGGGQGDPPPPPPFYVKRFEYPEKCYINVRNYYYYLNRVDSKIAVNTE